MRLSKKQSGFALPIAILMAVVLIVVGGVGYYFYKTSQEQKEVEVAKPEQVIDETADWKAYRNEKYGFILKFPESWADFEVKEYKWDQSTEPGLLPPYYDVIDFLRTRTPEYDFSIQIQAYSYDSWAVRRLGQQTKKNSFISASHLPYPCLGENMDYVFSWISREYISHPGMSQEEYTTAEDIIQLRTQEAESIISTFKIINPLEKTAEWKNYFNPGECKDIEENNYTNECYLESIKTLTEAIMCKRIRPDYQDFCYFQIAQSLKQPSICQNLSVLINQESCYQNVAQVLKDASICGNIPTERWRNTCYGDVAELLKDPSICEKIANPKAKGYCLMGANPEQPELPIPPISEWKTYINEKYKYSFKHPPKWNFQVSLTNPETSSLRTIRETISNQTQTHSWRWVVTIDAWDNPSELSLIDWLKFRGEPGGLIPEDMPFAANTIVGEEKIEALQVWQGGTSTWDKPGKPIMSFPYLEVYFVHKDKGYRATLGYQGEVDQESQEIFKQILSTFKFIEGDKTVQISVFVDMGSFDLVNKTFEGWWTPKIGEKTKVKVITTDSTEFYRTSEPEWKKEYFTFSELYSKTVRTWPLTVKGIFEKEGVIKANEVFIIAQ